MLGSCWNFCNCLYNFQDPRNGQGPATDTRRVHWAVSIRLQLYCSTWWASSSKPSSTPTLGSMAACVETLRERHLAAEDLPPQQAPLSGPSPFDHAHNVGATGGSAAGFRQVHRSTGQVRECSQSKQFKARGSCGGTRFRGWHDWYHFRISVFLDMQIESMKISIILNALVPWLL